MSEEAEIPSAEDRAEQALELFRPEANAMRFTADVMVTAYPALRDAELVFQLMRAAMTCASNRAAVRPEGMMAIGAVWFRLGEALGQVGGQQLDPTLNFLADRLQQGFANGVSQIRASARTKRKP